MSLRCLLGLHVPAGIVARGQRLHVRCDRCERLSPGVLVDGPPPRVTQPKAKSRTWWLRAVYEQTKGA